MASRKKAPARKASGANIEDWQRGTQRITLRLRPDMMRLLGSLASEYDSMADCVGAALKALDRELDAECRANGMTDPSRVAKPTLHRGTDK